MDKEAVIKYWVDTAERDYQTLEHLFQSGNYGIDQGDQIMAATIDQSVLSIAKEYLQVLREHNICFESAWLFGSYAENRSTEESDIDIALVMEDVAGRFLKEVELMKYRRNIDFRIEPHILSAEELDSPFGLEVVKNGIRIT
ncbi:MAG: nucleotidyltransferase domain-containing protein [bacterium]